MATESYNEETDRSILAGMRLAHPDPGEEIVISGIAGSFPNSLNVNDFKENLFNKKDLVSFDNRRWDIKHPEIPPGGGRLYKIEKFDAAFFGIHYKQAQTMDPMARLILEKTFEALIDAGINPAEIKGTKTGVFVGSCFSEAEKTWFYENLQPHGYGITGCIRSMIANRISYWLGVDGPSYVVDTACSSSSYAIEHGYRAIRMGQCDYAIIGGCNLCLHPYVTLQFSRLGVLNMDGKCKCFDDSANGYTRAEAIVVAILQKSKDARRIYCQIVHAKTNCDGYKEQGITYPSGALQCNLLKEFYTECNINPCDVNFIEAHGTGTRVGDPEELGAVEKIFCPKERKTTLMIGSVKSNIGHAEPVSGLCSITKAILAMETGYLIPNINLSTPRKDIKSLHNGKMQVITEKMKWKGGYVAVSSFGFGGANCHTLLKWNPKEKINNGIPKDDLPRLVYISGRTEEAVNCIFDNMIGKPMDAELIGLLHEIYKYDIPAHLYRGYTVFTKNEIISREVDHYPYDNKPLWFIFSGLGSQWLGMATDLMKIPTFAGTIEKCQQILSPKGINVTDLLTNTDPNIFCKQSNIIIAITTIQIALVELLKLISIVPTGIIGYSIGEISSAYYDGCLTMEQALLCAYYLGQASDRCKNRNGSIISVEINHKKINSFLGPEVELSCINSEHNCFVSGPFEKIQEFTQLLKENDILYQEIDCNVAYHSTYIKEIASVVKYLKKIIPQPKSRSEKWISCNKFSKLCSAEFLSTILTNSINLKETFSVVPNNAITLEISPQGLLQNALKRSVFDTSININLMNKNSNNLQDFLSAIGKLYKAGLNPRIEKIYPKIKFPVSRGTMMLSSLVKWDHSHDWFVTKFEVQDKIKSGERTVTVKLNDEDNEYLVGHSIDGRILYPATGYLNLVWETVGLVRGRLHTEFSVVFENVKFLRATNVPKEGRIYIIVMVQKVSGNFEVIESGNAIVTGHVYIPEDDFNSSLELPVPIPEKKDYYVPLQTRDIYKELRLRGYNYSGLFRGLKSCDTTATVGRVEWKSNWVAFMDTILQMQILQEDTRGLFVPTAIEKLVIDIPKQKQIIQNLPEDDKSIPIYVYRNNRTLVCGGVLIQGLNASAIARKKYLGIPVLETYKFIPNVVKNSDFSLEQSVRIMLHVTLENILSIKVKTAEMLDENSPDDYQLISPIILEALADLPLKQPDVNVFTTKSIEISGVTVSDKKIISETDCMIVIATNILKRGQALQAALNATVKDGFILAREDVNINLSEIDLSKVNILIDHELKSERLILLSKASEVTTKSFIDITDVDNQFNWVSTLQNILQKDTSPCIYAQGDEFSGILGFVNCLRFEPETKTASCVFIMDKNAPKFNPNDDFYAQQLRKKLAMNIFKNGQWGTYRHLLMEEVKTVEVEHAYVNVTVRGDLSSLRWLEGSLSRFNDLNCNKVLVHTYYSAMNFRDIMTATGRIAPEFVARGRFEQDCVQGLEFSGRLSDGRRVMGMVSHMATATLISADPLLMWDVPEMWTLEEAVTIPVVYGTVLYALENQGKIRPGMSILIHSGTGGVGQAAITIALFHGCTVYTTVGTPEKREFIKKNWPQIKDNQIGNSHDTSFEQMIMLETKGRGVDLVLNSLAEEKLLASIRCLAHGGKFLEIGKFDLSKDNPLPLSMFEKDRSFHGIMLDTLFSSASTYKRKISKLVDLAIKKGAVKPLKRCIFKENEIEEMFRYMASGKHMGKVLLKIRDEEPEKISEPPLRLVKAVPRYYSNGNSSYIITGGLGGFGLELCDWLILRGVTNVVLTSRNGIKTGYQAMRIRIWKSYGVNIVVSTADITTYEGCKAIIDEALKLGSVEAIFNLAVVLKDSLFTNLTKEDYNISFGPKAVATKYFDELSREFCPDLKQFVIFSSVVCGRGNAGQTNYGMANSVMERICEKRQEDGLPALAVEWGAVGDVGLVAELQEKDTELVIGGTLQQRITNCLSVLDQFLRQKHPIVASMLVAEKRGGDGAAANIVDAVVNILGIRDVKTVSIHSTLAELGMDSIMAVEIKQTLEREFEVFLTPQDIRSMTFARLHEIAAERLSNESKSLESPEKMEENVVSEMGMHFLLRAIGDEENSNKPLIFLPSKASPNSKERIILIPGIEGMASVLETLASNLNVQPVCLQLGFSNLSSTIKDMAESLLDRALANIFDLKSGFTIVGYSYGGAIALELAALLEAKGTVGNVIFIDGAPEMLKIMSKEHVDSDDEAVLQNKLLSIFVNNVVSGDIAKHLLSSLEQYETWEEKLDSLMKNRPTDTKYTESHYRRVCNAIYNRVKAILKYEPEVGKLQSKFTLIKPNQATVVMETEDFGLSEYSVHPVEVIYMEGTHVLIIENLETSEHINKVVSRIEEPMKKSDFNINEIKKEILYV